MKKEIKVSGMHCSHCVRHIEEALEDLRIKHVNANLDSETVTIEYDNNVSDKEIINALEDIGYEVNSIIDI